MSIEGKSEGFQEDDPYDQAAWWNTGLLFCPICNACSHIPDSLMFSKESEDADYHIVGQIAKRDGWIIRWDKGSDLYVRCKNCASL